MRILVVTPYFYPHLGGSERYIEQLYTSLMQLDNSIHVDVLTYAANGNKKTERYKGMTIYRVGCVELLKGQFSIPNYFELISLLRRLKKVGDYHIVNSHTRFFENSWWVWYAARYLGALSVLTDHCADHPYSDSLIVRTISRIIDHLMIPWLGKKYDLITVVSNATKLFLKHHGVNKNCIVIPNSVEIKTLLKRPQSEKIFITFVGRQIPAKGANLFLAVAKIVKQEYPECQFTLVTNKTHTQVMNRLAKTDILIHPSIHHEGLPTVILEAGVMGCAVIASNRGGTGEVIVDGETGILVKPQVKAILDATRKLIVDPTRRLKLGLRLRKKVENEFNWKHTAERYQALIYQTLKFDKNQAS